LWAIEVDQHGDKIILLILDSDLHLAFLDIEDFPSLGSPLIFITVSFLDVLFGGYFDNFFGKFVVIFSIFSQKWYDAPEGVGPFQQVGFYGSGHLLENEALGVQNLQCLQDVDVLRQHQLGQNARDEQTALHWLCQFLGHLVQERASLHALMQGQNGGQTLGWSQNYVQNVVRTMLRTQKINVVVDSIYVPLQCLFYLWWDYRLQERFLEWSAVVQALFMKLLLHALIIEGHILNNEGL
jgi:hypothetical protein